MKIIPIAENIDCSKISHIDRFCDSQNLYLIESTEDYVNLPSQIYSEYLNSQALQGE